ncbi:MAG: tetratricopeptide repeat protein [Pyrinomonadaceae bacterium]
MTNINRTIFILTLFICGSIVCNGQTDIRPSVSEAINVISLQLLMTGNKVEASNNFKDLLTMFPESRAVRYNLAVLAESNEDWDQAEKWLLECLRGHEESGDRITTDAKIEIEKIKKIRSLSPEEQKESTFRLSLMRTKTLAEFGDVQGARQTLSKVEPPYTKRCEFFEAQARIEVVAGNGDAALTLLDKAIASAPPGESARLKSDRTLIERSNNASVDLRSMRGSSISNRMRILGPAFDILDLYSFRQRPDLVFPMIYGMWLGKDKPFVVDSRASLTNTGICNPQPIPNGGQISVVDGKVRADGKTVYDLREGENLQDTVRDGKTIRLLFDDKIVEVVGKDKKVLSFLKVQNGRFFSPRDFYSIAANQKLTLHSVSGASVSTEVAATVPPPEHICHRWGHCCRVPRLVLSCQQDGGNS